jgi:signal transduction histidine kinase
MMIVHRIMRDHGGEVGIDSKDGSGTIVTLEIPRKSSVVLLNAERGQ